MAIRERAYPTAKVPRNAAVRVGGMPVGKDGKGSCRVSVTVSKTLFAELERAAKKQGHTVSKLMAIASQELVERINGGPMLDLGGIHAQR